MPPSGWPHIIMATALVIRARVETLATALMMLGITPPMANPASTRATIRPEKSVGRVVSTVATPRVATDATSTGLRPNRSAKYPPITAPIASPIRLALKIQPNCSGPRCMACCSFGPAMETTCRSKPSTIAAKKQSAMTMLRRIEGIATSTAENVELWSRDIGLRPLLFSVF